MGFIITDIKLDTSEQTRASGGKRHVTQAKERQCMDRWANKWMDGKVMKKKRNVNYNTSVTIISSTLHLLLYECKTVLNDKASTYITAFKIRFSTNLNILTMPVSNYVTFVKCTAQ
jgi:hypothetical protein